MGNEERGKGEFKLGRPVSNYGGDSLIFVCDLIFPLRLSWGISLAGNVRLLEAERNGGGGWGEGGN